MFDFSISQLFLVFIIGLIVLGPKRLPIAIKTVTNWIKMLRALSSSVQLELSKELKLHELQETLRQAKQKGLHHITPEINASIKELKRVTASLQETLQKEISNATSAHDDPEIESGELLNKNENDHEK